MGSQIPSNLAAVVPLACLSWLHGEAFLRTAPSRPALGASSRQPNALASSGCSIFACAPRWRSLWQAGTAWSCKEPAASSLGTGLLAALLHVGRDGLSAFVFVCGASQKSDSKEAETPSAPDALFKLVSPEGVLHFVPRINRVQETRLLAFSKAHELRNEYLKNCLGLSTISADEHKHWQPLHKVRWLQHIDSGVIVVVVGGAQHFVDSIDSIRERAGFRNAEMKLINFDRVAWLLRPPDVRSQGCCAPSPHLACIHDAYTHMHTVLNSVHACTCTPTCTCAPTSSTVSPPQPCPLLNK
jgi:hypothetical protein